MGWSHIDKERNKVDWNSNDVLLEKCFTLFDILLGKTFYPI